MNPRSLRLRTLLGLPIALASFCVAAQTTTTAPPPGRLLASNCFQCHGYDGKSSIGFERLSGESVSEITKELREMRSKSRPDIMDIHARGYSDEQILLIATYLSQRKTTASSSSTSTESKSDSRDRSSDERSSSKKSSRSKHD